MFAHTTRAMHSRQEAGNEKFNACDQETEHGTVTGVN